MLYITVYVADNKNLSLDFSFSLSLSLSAQAAVSVQVLFLLRSYLADTHRPQTPGGDQDSDFIRSLRLRVWLATRYTHADTESASQRYIDIIQPFGR